MRTGELTLNQKKNNKFTINLSFAGFFHFLADFLPVSTLYLYASSAEDFFFLVVTYNLLAFGLQPFIGLLIDRYERSEKSFCVSSIILLLLGALLTFNFYLSAILLGLGNAIFHVAFAKDVVKKAKSSFPLGVFIAPGVLGLGIGFTFLNDFLRLAFIFAGFIGLFLYIRFKEDYGYETSEECASKRNYKPLNFTPILYVIFVCLTVLSIFFRGSLGKLTPTIDVAYLFYTLVLFLLLGNLLAVYLQRKYA